MGIHDKIDFCREKVSVIPHIGFYCWSRDYDTPKLQPAEIGLKKLMRKGAMIPKFMGPKGETWTGRGRKPIWLQQAELEGKSLEDFRITSPVAMEEDEDARLEELTRPDNVKA